MALYTDPRYVALARRAAAALGAASDPVAAAILAQWTCEQPTVAYWPVPHNNPGNLTSYIGTLGGPPPPLATTAPGAGLLYAYPTPEAGADAYARYLVASPRYATAIARARAGDGAAFLAGVCAAGYGTRADCALAVYPHVQLAPPPAPAAPPASWRLMTADAVNVRKWPELGAPVLTVLRRGAVVSAHEVAGGAYRAAGKVYGGWLAIDAGPLRGLYVARAFFGQL